MEYKCEECGDVMVLLHIDHVGVICKCERCDGEVEIDWEGRRCPL